MMKSGRGINYLLRQTAAVPLARLAMKAPLATQVLYSPWLAQLVVTRRCNLACGYCNEFDGSSDPVPVEALRHRVEMLWNLGTFAIEFTGGEPLLHPSLDEIVRYATDLGFVRRMLISNAFLLTPERIGELNRAGLTHLQVSLDGVRPNETTRKVLNLVRKQLLMLKDSAAFQTTLSGVVGAATSDEVLEVIEFARENGFKSRVLLVHDDQGNLKLTDSELAVYRKAKELIGRNIAESNGYREILLDGRPAPFKCRAGARYLYVDEAGHVHYCSQRREMMDVSLDEYGPGDLKRSFFATKACNPYCTIGCVRTASAPDEWRRQ